MIFKISLVVLLFTLGLLFLNELVSLGVLVPILLVVGMVSAFIAAIAGITEK